MSNSCRSIQVRTVRFLPGQELKSGLEEFVKSHAMNAAFIMTCVGSLQRVTLRYATPAKPQQSTNSEKRTADCEMNPSFVNVASLCLLSGDDLKLSIENFVVKNKCQASIVLTCVGDLKGATLALNSTPKLGPPFPSLEKVESYDENLEICSLVGTVSTAGAHLHLVAGRADGTVIAGHLVGGAEVQTTAEVVLGDSLAESYDRRYDPATHYNELVVSPRQRR